MRSKQVKHSFFCDKNMNLLKLNEHSPSFTSGSSVPFMDNTIMSTGILSQTSTATSSLPNWISSNVISPSVDLVEMCQPWVSCAILPVGYIWNMENGEQKPFLFCCASKIAKMSFSKLNRGQRRGTAPPAPSIALHETPSNHSAPTYSQPSSFI